MEENKNPRLPDRRHRRRADCGFLTELIGGSAEPEKPRKKPVGASLAEFAGGWSEKEAREFEESVRVFEEVDEAMWK